MYKSNKWAKSQNKIKKTKSKFDTKQINLGEKVNEHTYITFFPFE